MDLFSPAAIRAIRARYGFHNAKSLGQNFLTDKRVIDAMIGAAGICPEDLVIEIGPGIGVLTVEAARCAGRVVAIEIDKALMDRRAAILWGCRKPHSSLMTVIPTRHRLK